jgi:hypothetical protein
LRNPRPRRTPLYETIWRFTCFTGTKAQILTQRARLGLAQSTPEAHAAIWDGNGISFRAAQRGCTVDAVAVRISAVVVVKGVSICTVVPVKQVN